MNPILTDFLANSHLADVSKFVALDFLTGTIIAVKNRVWKSQHFEHCLFKYLIKWIPLCIASYLGTTSGIPALIAAGHTLWTGACVANLGSALENIGAIDNDKTVLKCGKDVAPVAPTVTAQIEEGPKSV